MGSSPWDKQEQKVLEDGLRYYPHERHSNMLIYIRIAASLPKKTVRDVAHHLRHMQVGRGVFFVYRMRLCCGRYPYKCVLFVFVCECFADEDTPTDRTSHIIPPGGGLIVAHNQARVELFCFTAIYGTSIFIRACLVFSRPLLTMSKEEKCAVQDPKLVATTIASSHAPSAWS